MLDLESAQPAWSQLVAPTPNSELTNCQSYYGDGRPTSRHSYYGVTFNEANDRFMLFGGVYWCGAGGFHRAISSFNVGSKSWNSSGAHPNLPDILAQGVAAVAAAPTTGDVYLMRGFAMGRWNRASNSVTTLSPSGPKPYGDEAMSAFDSTRGRVLVLGGLNNDRHLYTVATNTFVQISLTGTNAGNVSGVESGALIYVPAIDRFLIRLAGSGGTVYQIHPTTFEVTTFATTGGGSVPSTMNGPYNKFLYAPRLQGVVYVPVYGGNAWFLRVH